MKKEGLVEYFHDNGNLQSRGYYLDGAKEGEWEYFDEDGNFTRSVTFFGANASQMLEEFYKSNKENKEESK
jgi:antitoxin component YwqK of YwqJK toxin-antitoxin module